MIWFSDLSFSAFCCASMLSSPTPPWSSGVYIDLRRMRSGLFCQMYVKICFSIAAKMFVGISRIEEIYHSFEVSSEFETCARPLIDKDLLLRCCILSDILVSCSWKLMAHVRS